MAWQEDEDASPEKEHRKKCSYLGLATLLFICFGDGVELYIPSVITQPISCDLKLSKEAEGVLSVSIYICLGTASLISARLSDTLGRRPVLLVSMYLCILVTVLCAIIPNYTSLLLSRILLGLSIALNFGTSSVYFVELSADKKFYGMGITLATLVYSVGGGWCGAVAYFLLDKLGWRYFVLITSIPFFIPPLIMVQFFLPETIKLKSKESAGETTTLFNPMDHALDGSLTQPAESCDKLTNPQKPCPPPPLRKVVKRLFLLCLKIICNDTPYYGAILLVPSIMKSFNLREEVHIPCGAIHGAQFLIITVLFGACHILGRLLGYFSRKCLSSGTIFTINAIACLPWILFMNFLPDEKLILLVSLGAIQVHCSAAENEVYITSLDNDFFTSKYLGISMGTVTCFNALTIPASNILSEVVSYATVLMIHAGFFAANLLVSILFYFD